MYIYIYTYHHMCHCQYSHPSHNGTPNIMGIDDIIYFPIFFREKCYAWSFNLMMSYYFMWFPNGFMTIPMKMDRKSVHPPTHLPATSCSACWKASMEKTEGVAWRTSEADRGIHSKRWEKTGNRDKSGFGSWLKPQTRDSKIDLIHLTSSDHGTMKLWDPL